VRGSVTLLALLVACEGGSTGPLFPPSDARVLSTGSPTKDEDPSVLLARDSSIYVAWFSDRGANSDIYLTRTTTGATWRAPIRVTTNPGGDFYPNLFQDSVGTFHLVWFRWTAPNLGHIYHNTSADGLVWDTATEEQVTKASGVDDWVPTVAQAPGGTLLVYFVSALRDAATHNTELYVATKAPGDTAWTTAAKAAGINSPTENDHLPFAARTGGATITLVWVRNDSIQPIPYQANKTHLWYSTSANGLAWAAPQRITNDTDFVVHLFPQLYANQAQQWSLLWLSNRLGPVKLYELPAANFGQYTTATVENPFLPGAGYSHRIAPTRVAGRYIGVWVQGPDGSQDIYYRFFDR
jgi:hypothetical protein